MPLGQVVGHRKLLEIAAYCIEQQVVGADSHFGIRQRVDFGDWALASGAGGES
jgi:hypothetical protein